ncbi:MAG: amidohydrolase family protein [Anaerolineales bacterium]|nr:amidohydrolase family protein [Anaerolineales bacterium]
MIEIDHLPVIDAHCHPFLKHDELTADQFIDLAAFPTAGMDFMVEGGVPKDQAVAQVRRIRRDTVYVRFLVHQLAAFFDCEPSIGAVVAVRNRAVQKDFHGYVNGLYRACNLTAMVVDFGYPKPPVDVQQFKADSPVKVAPIYRIESFIDEWLDKETSWADFNLNYEETIVNALENEGYVGLKSVIAYRTGLDVSPLSRAADRGQNAWDALRRGEGSEKELRDHLLCRAIEFCIEFDAPLQIHTGIGDYEINLMKCRPACLLELLRSPIFRACKVVLVHAGYPYHVEAGYLANIFPSVYCDVSEGIPFGGHGARRIFSEILEMAPISKVMVGSDGYVVPEIGYVGAVLGKRALAKVLGELVEEKMLTRTEAQEAAELILAGNVRRLYGLKDIQ